MNFETVGTIVVTGFAIDLISLAILVIWKDKFIRAARYGFEILNIRPVVNNYNTYTTYSTRSSDVSDEEEESEDSDDEDFYDVSDDDEDFSEESDEEEESDDDQSITDKETSMLKIYDPKGNFNDEGH